jgi:hypothetical protein
VILHRDHEHFFRPVPIPVVSIGVLISVRGMAAQRQGGGNSD